MSLKTREVEELRIYAERVIPKDSESLARFHQECTPERILALIEGDVGNYDLRQRIQELEDEICDLENERDTALDEAEEWESAYYDLEGKVGDE